jgi:hypothetical protein
MTMHPETPTEDDLAAARYVLRRWGAAENTADPHELVQDFRAWAERAGWTLRVGWRPDARAYAACWHAAGATCEEQYFAEELGELRLVACAGLITALRL